MPIIVIGEGRSGSTALYGIMRASRQLECFEKENCNNLLNKEISDNFCCKFHPLNHKHETIINYLSKYKCQILMSLRDPRDMAMSKLIRGAPGNMGGDQRKSFSDDGTPDLCVSSIKNMTKLYKLVLETFPDQSMIIKLEDIILNLDATIDRICNFAGIQKKDDMREFYKFTKNKHKLNRYSCVDTNELSKWKNWRSAYNGWLAEMGYDMSYIFEQLEEDVITWGYEDY